MLLPSTYAIPANGAVGGSGTGYYYYGSDGSNRRKFRVGPAVVEAGWLSGFTAAAPVGSNLRIRDVVRYFRVTSNIRFTASPSISLMLVARFGNSNAVFPGISTNGSGNNNWIWD